MNVDKQEQVATSRHRNAIRAMAAAVRVLGLAAGVAGLLGNCVQAQPISGLSGGGTTVAVVSVERLRAEIEDLRGLLEARLPTQIELQALFEIDLGDPFAVAARAQALSERLATAAQDETGAASESNALRRTRDTLRLAFLNMPLARREALQEQDRLRRQSAALKAEQQKSAAAVASSEEARNTALATASAAADQTSRMLATEEARLLAHLSELSSLRQGWVERKQVQLKKYSDLLSQLVGNGAGPELTVVQADQRYNSIRSILPQLRQEADLALAALTAPTAVLPLGPGIDLNADADMAHSPDADRIRKLRAKIAEEEIALKAREAAVRYASAQDVMNALRTLQAQRLALVPKLSAERRSSVTGFTREGLDRVLGEVAHVRLMARWYPVHRLHDARDLAHLLRNSFNAPGLGFSLAGILALIVALVVIRRHGQRWMVRLRSAALAHIDAPTLRRMTSSAMHMLSRVVFELVLLLAVYLCFDHLLVDWVGQPEIIAFRNVAYAYAWYRLALALIHRVLLVAVSRYQLVEASLNAKILRSLRIVARLTLGYVLYVTLAQALLGRGALYGIAREVAVLGVVLVGWWLIRDWRTEVASAYLGIYPNGRLADRVRASQKRSHGLFVGVAAFVIVAARGVWVWLRDSALQFEQTRKALAYLFRRQLERKAKNQSAAPDPNALPQDLQDALTEDAVSGPHVIDVYPQLDETRDLALGMLEGKPGALIAMSGERGVGKTSWLLSLQARLGDALPCRLHTFVHRDPSVEALCTSLCEVLQVEATTDPDTLIARLQEQAAQVVLLDLVQNVFLRTVGGLAGHQALIRIAQATSGHMVWVLAYARWPFEFIQRTQPDRDVYDQVVILKAWSEQQISALLDGRMAQAGYTADYEQLSMDPTMANPILQPITTPVSNITDMERSADRYHRLVWDYADGNPRIALHFFRHSLVWSEGQRVTVRLFPMPQVDALEPLEIRTWFVLACLVQHENLTLEEAADSLRFPIEECDRALRLMQQLGFLCVQDDRYRATTQWSRAVLRFLQRKKLLAV